MSSKKKNKKLQKVRAACIDNAEKFLSVAEKELGNRAVNHISYHLALLAMEEIGKSILATISFITTTAGKNKPSLIDASDDHKKKIFWAIWGKNMLRDNKFTKETIEQNKRLADTLHKRRLDTLYTNTRNPLPIEERIQDSEVKTLVELTRTRLKLEKTQELVDFEEGDVKTLKWFFNAVEDIELKKQIFNSASIKKLQKLGSGKDWIKWLYDTSHKNTKKMRELAEKELKREEPQGKERDKNKYLMRVRIQTPSHSIRGNAFVKWNKDIHNIKIYKSNRKDIKKLTKGEIYIDVISPKSVPPHALWEHGLFMSKTVVIGMNIATLGVFWWNVQKNVDKYYEYIQDLEANPEGGVRFTIAPHKRLHINFDEARLVLDENTMRNVNYIVAFFLRENKMMEKFLSTYAMGLTFFSKIDVHLRLEVNAFEEFYKALKMAMQSFGDWDGKNNFKKTVMEQYKKIGKMKNLEEILKLGEALEADTKREKHHPITLTEIIAMKIYCDYYMQLKAKEYFEKLDKKEENE